MNRLRLTAVAGKWRPQFSLRTLFAVTTLCCIAMVFIGKIWTQSWDTGVPGVIVETRYGWPAPIVGVIYHRQADVTNIGGYTTDCRCLWLVENCRFTRPKGK